MTSEQSKITAHYVNGLAIAVVATLGAAYLAGKVPVGLLAVGALASIGLHIVAIWITRWSEQ